MPVSILERPAPPPDQRLPYGEEKLQYADLRLPDGPGPHPVVVNVHGGFWRAKYDLEHASHLCAALTEAGYTTWNLEYRRVGNEGGGWPGTFLDAAKGTDYLRTIALEYNLDLDRVIVMGHSAGGHLALWLTGRHRLSPGTPLYDPQPLPLHAAISLAGVVDLRWASAQRLSDDGEATDRLMGGRPAEYPERYDIASPIELLPLGVPQILLHGTADSRVPFEISQRYVDAARAQGEEVELVALPGAGHFELIDPETKEWGAVMEAVRRVLG
ncbi:MAG: alpha/beta fold hydrolase [Chloroflexota bacterium]|nr:alpha/beta fold hydrolase [Chloroflexota bacterium]